SFPGTSRRRSSSRWPTSGSGEGNSSSPSPRCGSSTDGYGGGSRKELALRFVPTRLAGAYVVEQERHADERGFFARTWCAREFADHNLESELSQCSVSFNHRRATLRGLHYQAPPFAEVKLVRCTRGALYDVAEDLR